MESQNPEIIKLSGVQQVDFDNLNEKRLEEISRYKDIFNNDDKKKQYDERAEKYDEVFGTVGYGDPDVCARAVNELGLSKDIKIMDFGCGTGRVATSLVELGYKNFDGIDASPEMLKICKDKGNY